MLCFCGHGYAAFWESLASAISPCIYIIIIVITITIIIIIIIIGFFRFSKKPFGFSGFLKKPFGFCSIRSVIFF